MLDLTAQVALLHLATFKQRQVHGRVVLTDLAGRLAQHFPLPEVEGRQPLLRSAHRGGHPRVASPWVDYHDHRWTRWVHGGWCGWVAAVADVEVGEVGVDADGW